MFNQFIIINYSYYRFKFNVIFCFFFVFNVRICLIFGVHSICAYSVAHCLCVCDDCFVFLFFLYIFL